MSRAYGHGTINEIVNEKTGEIRYRARLARIYGQQSVGIYATHAEANNALADWTNRHINIAKGAQSFKDFAKKVLELRKEDGIHSVKSEEYRFSCHLEDSTFAEMAVTDILPVHVSDLARSLARKNAQDKRGTRKIARATVQRVLALVSTVFAEAVDRGIRVDNPCLGVRIKKKKEQTSESEEEAWDFLRLEEQEAVLACDQIPEWGRCMLAFAWGTGLRLSEQWCLELADLHVDGPEPYVFVRWGSPGRAPKNGKRRKVFLFGVGLWAAKRWLELLPDYLTKKTGKRKVYKNQHNLVFPSVTGRRRPTGDAPSTSTKVLIGEEPSKRTGMMRGIYKESKVDLLPEWLKLAGVKRHIRWHDLRHTFCSSLVSGFWGRAWALTEVKEAAGHSSVTVTEKYAHLADTAQKKAARETAWKTGSAAVGSGPVRTTKGSEPVSLRMEMFASDPSHSRVTGGGIAQELVATIMNDFEKWAEPGLNWRPTD